MKSPDLSSEQDHLAPRQGLTAAVLLSAAVAAIGGLLFGFDTAVISGAEKAIQAGFALDALWHGFTVASALIGTIVGSVVIEAPRIPSGGNGRSSSWRSSTWSRRWAAGWRHRGGSWSVSRFVGGIAIGGASVVAPMYIAEISPPHLRGRLVAINQLNVVVGILLSFISNYVISLWFPPEAAWRWMLGVVALPSAAFLALVPLILESPRWLVKAGRTAEAGEVLERLGYDDVAGELGEIAVSLQAGARRGTSLPQRVRPVDLPRMGDRDVQPALGHQRR